jgi:hypothetical protein
LKAFKIVIGESPAAWRSAMLKSSTNQ